MNNLKMKKQDYKISLLNQKEIKACDIKKQPLVWKLIIGENYDFLKNVNGYTRNGCGLVDVIYLDIAYDNAGNMNVDVVKNRLELAKKFISYKGVIFVSVDDIERVLVKNICDIVFSKNNFVMELVKQNKSENSDNVVKNSQLDLFQKSR